MTDHYATLGVPRTATQTQIKAAYRRHAKTAHPDAGGSVEAMAKVNDAYKILSDPQARDHYDDISAAETTHRKTPFHHTPESDLSTQDREEAQQFTYHAEREEAAHIDRQRTSWARQSAWEMARLSAPVTVVVVLAMHYVPGHLATLSSRLATGLLTFIPVYMLVLSIIFLINPELRLIFADLVRHHHTTHHERMSALSIVLAFFPLAGLWAILFLH